MKIITGLMGFFFGFVVLLLGIMVGFTIIGIPFAMPIAAAGFAKMLQGMAMMGIGSYEAAKSAKERGKQDV